MALINKIRERSGIAVAVIAVALILFIVGGDLFSGGNGKSGLFSSNNSFDVLWRYFQGRWA